MRSESSPARGRFQFISGTLWLDFVNSRMADRGRPVETLQDPASLRAWLEASGIAGARPPDRIPAGEADPADAALLRRALEFRGALHAIALALIENRPVESEAIGELNEVLATVSRHHRIVASDEGTFDRLDITTTHGAMSLLAPIAESASEWLAKGDRALLRRCGNPKCVLLFLDTTRNHQRRWCSMAICGNRMKAAAFYRRGRRTPAGQPFPAVD